MSIRIATYNANNLFRRANLFELEGMSAQSAAILHDIATLEDLLAKSSYAGAVGQDIVKILNKYEVDPTTGKSKENPWFFINEVRKSLYHKDQSAKSVVLNVAGRSEWLGWIELKRDTTNADAQANTARVIAAIKADVLCMVEVEDRPALQRFNDTLLRPANGNFAHNLLVDGNDPRGIDVAVFSQFPIRSLRSHVDDTYTSGGKQYPIFSRDCAEYEIELSGGKTLWLLCNHFKSQIGGPAATNPKRKRQADRVKAILGRFNLGTDYVAVGGDFNDAPQSAALAGLLGMPMLHDVLDSPLLNGPRWTYGEGKKQFDYLLVSEALHNKMTAVGIERRGLYSKTNFGGLVTPFPQVKDAITQASDHAAVWASFNI